MPVHHKSGVIAMRTHTRPRAAGFTLVEILMVVIILGIASAVVVPNLGQRNDLVAAAAARAVVADIMYAQNRAILAQSMRYVWVQADQQRYSLLTCKPTVSPL